MKCPENKLLKLNIVWVVNHPRVPYYLEEYALLRTKTLTLPNPLTSYSKTQTLGPSYYFGSVFLYLDEPRKLKSKSLKRRIWDR